MKDMDGAGGQIFVIGLPENERGPAADVRPYLRSRGDVR